MKSILKASSERARRYFLEPENYCSMELPKYICFKPILDYVEKIVGDKRLVDILKNKGDWPSAFEDVNHRILVRKDARYTFRPMQIANPYLYYLLVNEITLPDNWECIKNRFDKFKKPQIEVSSIPVIKSKKDKTHKSAGVSNWWESIEQRSLALSLQYKYMFVTDISNCYPSVYTHAIAWALEGKEKEKEAVRKKTKTKSLGASIDTCIQGMQYGQTNGIPQGSVLYDFIAEMVLGFADMLLYDALSKEKIEDYMILRYRDDYRIFSNRKDELEKIAFSLQEVLSGLNFQLNAKKTKLTDEIVLSSIKPDKLSYVRNVPLYKNTKRGVTTMASSPQQEALFIYQFSKEHPNSGMLQKLLTLFSKRVTKKTVVISEKDAEVLIAIFTEVALGSPKTHKLVLHLISFLISKFSSTKRRESIVRSVYEKFLQFPNIGELQIWMQRITYKLPHSISYPEPLCRLVAGEKDVVLWNNDWLKDDYKVEFPMSKICNKTLRDTLTPIINIDEVSLFETYR